MTPSIIVATDEGGVIGRDNQLPWRLSSDLKRFKTLTMGHALILGRKTWDSIGRPLPGRRMIVVTRDRSFAAEGAEVAHSLDGALALAASDAEPFIAGGAEIYRQSIGLAARIYLTLVHARVEGDAHFPPIEPALWREVSREGFPADEKNEYPHSFVVYERR